MMKRRTLLFAAIALLASLFPTEPSAQQQKSESLVFTRVTVIDMTGAQPKPDMTVVIEGNRIAALDQANKVRVPEGARVVDARGKFMIPGLWDMHAHTLGKSREDIFLPLFIVNGVTGVRNMHTVLPLEHTVQWRNDIAGGRILGPRLVANGPLVDGPHQWNHAGSLVVSTAEEARRAVDSLAAGGADFIKVYTALSREAYFAIAEQSKRRGIPFAGHIPARVRAEEAAAAGQRSIEHLDGLNFPCSTNVTRCNQVLAAYKHHGTWQVPTLALYWSWTVADSILSDTARIKFVPSETRKRWSNSIKGATKEQRDKSRAEFETISGNVRLLYREGVPILAGTDVGNPFLVPGFSLHDELRLFVQAGMTPLEAMRTATYNPAKFLGLLDSHGTVERGKMADLVLLDANPLEDISNTRRINAVVVNGKYLPKGSLLKMLADVEAAATGK